MGFSNMNRKILSRNILSVDDLTLTIVKVIKIVKKVMGNFTSISILGQY